MSPPQAVVGRPPSRFGRNAMLVAAGVLASAGIAAYGAWKLKPSPAAAVTRFAFTLPQGQLLTLTRPAVTISPDGARMVYAADGRLYIRSMSGFESRPIPGADPAISPVFSPDGESLLFWSESLKRIAVTGGPAVTVCQLDWPPAGITWSNEGIVFTDMRGIMRVSPDGGTPELIVSNSSDEMVYGPQLLAGALIVVRGREAEGRGGSIDGTKHGSSCNRSQRACARRSSRPEATLSMSRRAISCTHRVGRCSRSPSISTSSKRRGVPCLSSKGYAVGPGGPALPAWRISRFPIRVRSSTYPARPGVEQGDLVLFDRKGGTAAPQASSGPVRVPARVSRWQADRVRNERWQAKSSSQSTKLSGASSMRRLTFGGNNRFPTLVPRRPPSGVSIRSRRRSGACSGSRLTVATPSASRNPAPERRMCRSRGLPTARCSCSARRRTWITHSGRSRCAIEKRHRSARVQGSTTAHQRLVLARRPLGGVSDRTKRDVRRDDLRPAVPADRDQAPDRTRRPPAVVPRRQGALLHTGTGAVSGRDCEHTTDLYVHQTRRRAARCSRLPIPRLPRPFDLLPDGRFVGVGVADPGPGGPQIHVVLNWFEELKARVSKK